jgi:two-component system OmpR family sensor kinase
MTTLRRRLTVWYTVALGITVLVFGTLLYMQQRQWSIQSLDRRLQLEADLAGRWLSDSYRLLGSITHTTTDSLRAYGPVPHATDSLARLPRSRTALDPSVSSYLESRDDYAVVGDASGQVLALSDPVRRLNATQLQRLTALLAPGGPERRSGTVALGAPVGTLLYLVTPLQHAGPVVRVILVATPIAEAAFGPAALLRSMTLIAPLVLASALIVGYWLARTGLQPLEGITDELEAITDGRSLHRRVAVPMSGGDELNRLVLTLNGMIARLELSFASLRRFTADASHELKTPLMVLRAGVERALTHPSTPPEVLPTLDETLAQINRMSEMVEGLLTLARADEGRAPLAVEDCDLRDILADVAETAGILGDDAGVAVIAQFPDTPVRLRADRQRIREMLLNLVTNAVKYTPSGGNVGLSLTEEQDHVTISVRDSGIGIAPGDLPHIFDRFWRADPARSRTGERPGTGLGLAITKWIAEVHGGSITVQSRPGRGTIFTVMLPKPANSG